LLTLQSLVRFDLTVSRAASNSSLVVRDRPARGFEVPASGVEAPAWSGREGVELLMELGEVGDPRCHDQFAAGGCESTSRESA
jgi:hypothetical protein